jgi:hypothetical protein
MVQPKTDLEALERRVVRLTPRKVTGVVTMGILAPLYFVLSSTHFRPGEWGRMFWVVFGTLWLVGIFAAGAAYMGLAYLSHKTRPGKS